MACRGDSHRRERLPSQRYYISRALGGLVRPISGQNRFCLGNVQSAGYHGSKIAGYPALFCFSYTKVSQNPAIGCEGLRWLTSPKIKPAQRHIGFNLFGTQAVSHLKGLQRTCPVTLLQF